MTVAALTPTLGAPGRYDRQFYTVAAIAAAVAVIVGFAPTFYLRSRFLPTPLPFYLQAHGFLFTLWIVFFMVQTTLVASRRTDLHRKLGCVGAGLAALMVVAGVTAGILSGQRDVAAGRGEDAETFLTVPLFSMAAFAVLVATAVAYRSRLQAHKRLMLLATISLLDAPIARWPGAPGIPGVYVLVDLFIVAGMLYDLASRRRVNPAYLWGGLFIVAGQVLRGVVGQTETWGALARSLIGLIG